MRGRSARHATVGGVVTLAVLLLYYLLQPADVVRVVEVVDGDTIRVEGRNGRLTVRLIGVNTPETRHPKKGEEPLGREAKEFTKRRLLGRNVHLEFDVETKDRYGRYLAYVWLEKPSERTEDEVRERMFNAILVLEGYAQVMTVPPNVRYAGLFVKFQTEARSERRGLWGLR